MKRLLVATLNPGKVREMRRFLTESPDLDSGFGLGLGLGKDGSRGIERPQVLGLEGFRSVVFPEEGDAYEPNAIAKAQPR